HSPYPHHRAGLRRASGIHQPDESFREVARGANANEHMQGAQDAATARLYDNRLAAWDELDDVEALREQAHEIRMRTIDDLDKHVAEFTSAFESRGGHVRFAATADEACSYVVDVCSRAGAKVAAKSKPMA